MDLTTRPPRRTRTAHIGIRTYQETKDALEGIAWRRGQTMTEWLESIFRREIRRDGGAKKDAP